MHLLFVHQNFPAQFGHIAARLVREHKWKCTFVSNTPAGVVEGVEKIHYAPASGARKENHFCSRTFENQIWHCDAVYQALKARPDVKPDLIVGHSGFGSTLFLRDLYPDTPVVNLFEWFYHPRDPDNDMNFRRRDLNWATPEIKYMRARARNAMLLLDLHECTLGYCPTKFQLSQFPREFQPKLRHVFDGIDRAVYHGHDESLRPATPTARRVAGVEIPAGTRLVTYVSRGFESMRGFDIFMRAADLIARQYQSDVRFVVVGADRIAYGGDEDHTNKQSFKQWVLANNKIDLSRFVFTGLLPPAELARLLASTDLHIYLTVPFVLSWSMLNAMSCGATVLASDTAPVRELITDTQTGLLADFFSPDHFASRALEVLKDPAAFRPLARNAEQLISQHYSLDAVFPQMLHLYQDALSK